MNSTQVSEVLRAANSMDEVTEEQALIKLRQDQLTSQFQAEGIDLVEASANSQKLTDTETDLVQTQGDLRVETSKPGEDQDSEKIRSLNSKVRRLQRWITSNRDAILALRAQVSEKSLDLGWNEYSRQVRRLKEIEEENIRLPRVIEERTEFVKFSPTAVYVRFEGGSNQPVIQIGEALQADPDDAARFLPNVSGIDFFGQGRVSYSNRNSGPGFHPVHSASYDSRGGALEFDLFSGDASDEQGGLITPRRLHVKIVRTKYSAADGKARFQGDLTLYDLSGKLLKRGVLKLEGREETSI